MKFSEFKQLKEASSFEEALREVGKVSKNKEQSMEEIAMIIIQITAFAILAPFIVKTVFPAIGISFVGHEAIKVVDAYLNHVDALIH
ncbi:MAG: hypothetical protein K0R18_174 [Bacillales bacterium]|jgi:hypothetical protein|nr:hypothetical protein [Bacillales bacterium]